MAEEKVSPKSFSKAHFFFLVGGECSSLQSLIDSVVELTGAEIGVDYRQLFHILSCWQLLLVLLSGESDFSDVGPIV